MKKLLLTLLMGLFLSPLQIFADHYPYEELYPDPQPPLRSGCFQLGLLHGRFVCLCCK